MERLQAWNIKQLQAAMAEDLLQCNNDFERSMAKAIGGREIREKAEQWSKERKLTPIEVTIARAYGYKGN